MFVEKISIIFNCKFYNEKFISNNKLHRHVKQTRHQFKFVINFVVVFQSSIIENRSIIKFVASINVDFNYDFRSWNYAQISVRHKLSGEVYEKCVDIDTSMSLINRQFLNILSYDDIHRIFILIKIRGIGAREHDNFKWLELNFYIDDKFVDDTKVIVHFKCEMHIVDDFRVKLFINNDTFELKLISIHLKRREFIINNYEITIFVFIKTQNDRIEKIIRSRKQVIVSAHAVITILVKYKENALFTDRDYSFSFKFLEALNAESEFFAHIVFINVIAIQIKNASNTSFVVFKNMRINDLYDYKKENCYIINIDDRHFVVVSASDWAKRIKRFAKYVILAGLIIVNALDDAILL